MQTNHIVKDARITPNRFQSYPVFQQGFGKGGVLMGQAALVLGGYGFAVYQDSFDPRVEVALSFAHPETILPTIRRVGI